MVKQQELRNEDKISINFIFVRFDFLKSYLCKFEKEAYSFGFQKVAGVDEAGRGALAGPVVSAAVILPKNFDLSFGIDDSKKLSVKKREYLYNIIYSYAITIGIGIVDSFEIDKTDILKASILSMNFAVQNLLPYPDYLLIDGIFKIPLKKDLPQKTIIKGDSLSVSIVSASIVAKVTRDRLMSKIDNIFPEFGFTKHKGYATKLHKENIEQHGLCYIHRKTFKSTK